MHEEPLWKLNSIFLFVATRCLQTITISFMSSLSHADRRLSRRHFPLRFAAIGGERAGKGLIRTHPRLCLRMRLPADRLARSCRWRGEHYR